MTKIYLTKTSGQGLSYYISNISNLNWSIDTPVTPMPLPEDTHEENILVKMEGNTAKIDLFHICYYTIVLLVLPIESPIGLPVVGGWGAA